MTGLYITLATVGGIGLIILITSFVCFIMTFYSPKRKPVGNDEYPMPPGEVYEPFHDVIRNWTKSIREMPHEDIEITSYDGLRLCGQYFEYESGAPVELLFHGYRGSAERDLCGGVERCFAIGRNALIINQRASAESEGSVITFGIKEHRDCLSWINYAVKRFGEDSKIIITGVSMGAATVMMAAGEQLPENVVCVLADCGYSSAREIIKKVIADMGLPPKVFYPFVKLGALVFGGFKLEENSPIEAMKRCKIPIIFIHGDTDAFVPCDMSRELYEACSSEKKRFVTIPGAGHGLAFPANKQMYLNALIEFEKEWNI